MITLLAPSISRGDVEIRGGWTVRIPTIQLVETEEQIYARYLISRGVPSGEAVERVREGMQAVFNRAWFQSLRLMLLDRAEEYRQIHPDLGLRGFDPESLQAAYMPGERAGRAGKPFVKRLLVDMGRKVR